MESKRAYERVVGIVEHNTANEFQGPSMSERALRTIAGHAGLEGQEITAALEAAVGNDALVRFDRDEETRVAPIDEDTLRTIIDVEVETDPIDTDVVAACNTGIAAARGETGT